MNRRLRQNTDQLRMLPQSQMPRAPLEKGLIDAVRVMLDKMGFVQKSGRVWVRNHRPAFLPALGPGTPDILWWTRQGQMHGIEGKRDSASKERDSQAAWREAFALIGVRVAVVRTVQEAADFVREVCS